MLHTVIFIGPSGSGKGTQADLFKNWIHRRDPEKNPILYVETGERFRQFIRSEGYSSSLSKKVYDKDERQPDFIACWMWGNVLIEELDENSHLVFDGAARSKPEAMVLTTALRFYEREKTTVIYLDVSSKWSEKHLLSRGRFDDVNISKIDKRLEWFEKDTKPAIEYFKSDPFYRVIEVNGEQAIEKVHQDIIDAYGN
jgi:adenylate kinase family enzyme